MVGTPVSANLFGGEPAVIAAADKLYAWNSEGEPLPEFPISFGTYFWSTPLVADSFQRSSLLLCGWNGCLYMIDSALEIEVIQLSTQPIFAKPTLADIDGSGHEELLVGAWDSKLYVVEISQGYQNGQQLQSNLQPKLAGNLSSVLEATPPFISFSGQGTPQDTMYYRPIGEETWHPVPLIKLNGRPTGLIQPYPSGTTVSFWADIGGQREPVDGFYKYSVAPDIAGRLQRRVRRWLAKW